MKASPADQILLLDLQRADNDIARITHRIAELQKGAAIQVLVQQQAGLRGELAGATADVEDAERELARIESDTATVQARLTRDTTLLQNAKNAKDAAGLESEMANLDRRIGELETAELELMERMDTLQARVGDVEARLADVEAEHGRLTAEQGTQVASLTGDRESVVAGRAAVAQRVPADLLALYERQRERYGFGASLLQGGVTTASGVALTASDLAGIRAAAPDDVILCPDSDAILVRTNESGL